MKGTVIVEHPPLIRHLLSLAAIRERCGQLFALAHHEQLVHFRYHPEQLSATVDYVISVMRENYPDSQIPYHSRWRHFEAGGIDRMAEKRAALQAVDPIERGRIFFELAITSVLLDAGAGKEWLFQEPLTQLRLSRSEGLAIASWHIYFSGIFSTDPHNPCRADGEGLAGMNQERLARSFQVSQTNPLVGLEGRILLLSVHK